MAQQGYTPAAGRLIPISVYDRLLAILTRERTWRTGLLEIVSPKPGDRILDVGCGTGTFAIMLKQVEPNATIVGLDPDPEARSIAAMKATTAGVDVEWEAGFARDASKFGSFDKVVSSLVFHQVPVAEKRAGLEAMFAAVCSGGLVSIADYARQSRWLMRQAFRIIQATDGRDDTQPNADGFLEEALSRLCGRTVTADTTIDTPTGTISIFGVRVHRSE